MKRLTISYDGRELYDGDIAEFSWTENESGEITVQGRTTPKPTLGDALRELAAKGNAAGPKNGSNPLG